MRDLPLFMNIIKDLFPGVDIPYIDYGNLQKVKFNKKKIIFLLTKKLFFIRKSNINSKLSIICNPRV